MSTADDLGAMSPIEAAPYVVPEHPVTNADFMAQALIEAGLMTADQVAAGTAAEARGETYSPNAPVAGQFDHIEAGFRPPENAARYVMGERPAGIDHSPELEAQYRGIAHDIGLDAGMATDLANRWNAAQAAPLSEGQRAAQKISASLELNRAWGTDYEANMAVARRFVASVVAKHPIVEKMLDRSGLGNDPAVIRQFYLRGLARKA